MRSKYLIILTTILLNVILNVIHCERKKERFKININEKEISGTRMQKAFKTGFFGAKESKDKTQFAAGAARCAGEPSHKKIMKEWETEDEGPYKEAGLACHKAGKEWGEDAKQAFVAGASVAATNALGRGLNKIKLKETKHKTEE